MGTPFANIVYKAKRVHAEYLDSIFPDNKYYAYSDDSVDIATINSGFHTELEQITIEIATIEIQDFCNQDVNDLLMKLVYEYKGSAISGVGAQINKDLGGTSYTYKVTIGGILIRR